MIARIEYNNTLAPVQEYGRHQLQAKKKKKGKAVANGGGEENQKAMEDSDDGKEKPTKGGKGNSHYDDRYYDLDDNFIDDGDHEDSCYNNGLYGMGMGAGGLDEFDGLHDMEDDDVHSSNQN